MMYMYTIALLLRFLHGVLDLQGDERRHIRGENIALVFTGPIPKPFSFQSGNEVYVTERSTLYTVCSLGARPLAWQGSVLGLTLFPGHLPLCFLDRIRDL